MNLFLRCRSADLDPKEIFTLYIKVFFTSISAFIFMYCYANCARGLSSPKCMHREEKFVFLYV